MWTYKISLASFVLFVVGGLLFVVGLVFSATLPGFVLAIGIVALIASLMLRAILLAVRWKFKKVPVRRLYEGRLSKEPFEYTCHSCGYNLTGVQGINCPECGIVRQSVDGDEHS